MSEITIVNTETGEVTVRPLTTQELKQRELDAENAEAIKQAKAVKAAQRQALLDKLGITEDEARLLLGGN